MDDKKAPEQKITFVLKHAPDYCPQFISGVWGGINPTGLIEANFYTDHIPLPESTTHAIENGKMSGNPISRIPEQAIGPTRFVKQGIIMDLEMAKNFKQWLSEKIRDLEDIIGQSKTKPN